MSEAIDCLDRILNEVKRMKNRAKKSLRENKLNKEKK